MWWSGGCKPPNGQTADDLTLARLKDRAYSIEECYQKCSKTDKCSAFFLGKTTGYCLILKIGCSKSQDRNWDYYEMDTCQFANGMLFRK